MNRRPRLSSRQRVTVRILSALFVLWAAGGAILLWIVDRGLTAEIDADLQASAARGATILNHLSADILDDLTLELRTIGSDTALIIHHPDGTTTSVPSGDSERPDPLPDLAGRIPADLRALAEEPFTVGDVDGNDEQYRAIAIALDDGSVIVSARSLDQADDVLHQLRRLIVASLLVSFAAVIVLVWTISRWALRPLERVNDTAQQISAGTLSTRVEVDNAATDVERLADSLNTMLARLQDAFAAKEHSEASLRQFVADASHELRTPLAAIVGYADLYQQQIARQPDQIDHILDRITAESTRMQSLVEDLLLLARLDQGRPLERDALDLRPIVEHAVAAIQVIDHDRTYRLDIGAGTTAVVGDSVALRQIVDNLLTNVAAHTPPGTTADIRLTADEHNVIVVVSDDGPGMTPDEQTHAFDRFWRAEASRSRPGGNGLGLAIVADLVHAHDGKIQLNSEAALGSTFTISLPDANGAGQTLQPGDQGVSIARHHP